MLFLFIYIFCTLRKMAKVHMSILAETLVSFFLLHDHFNFSVLLSHAYDLWVISIFWEWVCVLVCIFWGLGLVKGQCLSWSVAAALCFGKLRVPSNSGSLSSLSVTRYWSMWKNKTCLFKMNPFLGTPRVREHHLCVSDSHLHSRLTSPMISLRTFFMQCVVPGTEYQHYLGLVRNADCQVDTYTE